MKLKSHFLTALILLVTRFWRLRAYVTGVESRQSAVSR